MLNKQIPIKQFKNDGLTLSVNSIFYTLQGEGPYAGYPAVFIRLAGCNLQCPMCDTEYTKSEFMKVGDIIDQVNKLVNENMLLNPTMGPIVVITGGEPFRQSIGRLVNTLLVLDWTVQIETNGTLFDDSLKYGHPRLGIVCSPKAGKVAKGLLPHIDAYKYVLHADQVDDDGLPKLALDHSASPRVARPHEGFEGIVYIQPVDVQDEAENNRHRQAAVDSAMMNGYILCLQIHKLVNVP